MFITANAINSTLSYSKNNIVGSVDITAIDTKKIGMGLEIGYKYNKNYFTTLNYQELNFVDTSFVDYFITMNYQFNNIRYKPFIGAIVGRSNMKWDKYPIVATIIDDKVSDTFAGLQAGVEHPINKKVSFMITYQHLEIDHITYLNTPSAKSKIINDNLKNLLLGIRYLF